VKSAALAKPQAGWCRLSYGRKKNTMFIEKNVSGNADVLVAILLAVTILVALV
jgi:hypothetical protein